MSARLWSAGQGAVRRRSCASGRTRAEKLRREANDGGANLPPVSYVVEYKFDGLTISLTYENGRLTDAATRGNGMVGEEILEQARTIRTVPLSIPFTGQADRAGRVHHAAFRAARI